MQVLADLGADVIKIEKPGSGDDTRGFAPPFVPGTQESAYFVGVNRNKRSVTLDIAKPDGQALALRLVQGCDILVENFKVGALAKYGLGYEQLHARFPGLIYCSITGFGQTGPYAPRPGYDSLIQAMGGVMSLTGEPDGLPQKVGVPVADLFAGLYGCIGVLAALRHRDATGQGQQVDIGMLDTSVAWLANQGMNYLGDPAGPAAAGEPASKHRALSGIPNRGRPHRAIGRQRPDLQALLRRCRACPPPGRRAVRDQRGPGQPSPARDRHADAGDDAAGPPRSGFLSWKS